MYTSVYFIVINERERLYSEVRKGIETRKVTFISVIKQMARQRKIQFFICEKKVL
jgi:hypothetical protein